MEPVRGGKLASLGKKYSRIQMMILIIMMKTAVCLRNMQMRVCGMWNLIPLQLTTVIPFATSASSGLGESGQLLADLAGTGDWQEGQRFRSGVDEADVQEWVNGLGL